MKIKRLTEDSLMARALGWVARAIVRRPGLFLYPQLALFAICVFYTVYGFPWWGVKPLAFDVSRANVVGPNEEQQKFFLRLKEEFPTQDDLVVVVQSADLGQNRRFVERLGARLEAETNLFHDVFYKGDLKMLGAKALLAAPAEDLVEMQKKLKEYRPFIEKFTHTTNLVSLFDMVNTQFRTATREQNAENDSMVQALPALERIITQAKDALRLPGTPLSPGVIALFSPGDEAEQAMYVTFANGSIYLVTAQAPAEDLNDAAVERLRVLLEQTKAEVPGVNAGLTGEPVLDHDEMLQSKKDIGVASVVSLVLSALIFIYGYQQTGRPVKATLCLIVGLGYTMAFATFAVGHLNVMTIPFLPILIGLAIDYGVHLISRYEEELRHGRNGEAALARAMVYTGQGIMTGAFTTAGAFLAMAFTRFRGIQEMGIICGGGLLICLVPMMTMLPVLLLKGRQNVIDHVKGDVLERRARIENIWLQRPVLVTCITVGLCVVAVPQLLKVQFDYDLRNMQSHGLPAVEFEKKLINSADKSVLFGAVMASNMDQVIEWEAKLKQLPAVGGVDSITRLVPPDQSQKLAMVTQIKQDLAPISFAEPDRHPVAMYELSRTLYSLYGYLGAAYDEVQTEEPALAKQLLSLREAIVDMRKEMLRGNEAQMQTNAIKLAAFQQAFFDDVRDTFQALQNQDDHSLLTVKDVPQALRDRFVGITGKYLLMVYPKKDAWQRENQREFIEQVQTVDPKVTGTPVQLYHYVELLKRSYEEAARYSLVAIVILVLLHFRSPLCLALALVPVAVGFIWPGGLMGFLEVQLNCANIMTLPLVIGIGVTNGIHILNRYAEEQTPSILARSTGKAVLVSGLTAIAGFGSLILAKHQGIQSLGYVMSAGLCTCMIAGLTFLPALLNLLMRRPTKRERPSGDNARSTLGREEPRSKTSSLG
jgi:uncharacterized protein